MTGRKIAGLENLDPDRKSNELAWHADGFPLFRLSPSYFQAEFDFLGISASV
jgi:hypothetical protein